MRHFTTYQIVSLPTGDRKFYTAPGNFWSIDFEVPKSDIPVTHKLRLKGETDYFWRWRMEHGAPFSVFPLIDDALTTKDTYQEKFALEFNNKESENYPKNFYLKVKKDNFAPGANYIFSIPVKGENFEVLAGGQAAAVIEIYLAKESRHPDDVYDLPDQIVELKFPEGTFDWTNLSINFKMPEDAVCLFFHAGTLKTKGKLLVGSPVLKTPELAGKLGEFNSHSANAVNLSTSIPTADSVFPPLGHAQCGEVLDNYFGENLSRREFLECQVLVDNKEIFRGEKFASIVRGPDFSFDAGVLLPGKHTFTLKLINNYENAIGFLPSFLELQELGNHEFEFIGAPETVIENEEFSALIRINKPNTVITDSFGNTRSFAKIGLYAWEFQPFATASAQIKLKSSTWEDSFEVKKVSKSTPRLLLSSGDAIYVPHEIYEMEEFLEWYIENHIGNCICFRHSYRWGGARACNIEMWKHIIPLLNELKLYYTVMVDGREVPGMNSNPPEELLQGPYYIGRRSHENDGAFNYWGTGNLIYEEPFSDILSRSVDMGGIIPHIRPVHKQDKAYLFYDPYKAINVKEAAEYFVENLRQTKGPSTRHSGPSALFRYFFQAGYENLLAEQMYCAEDVILSALRGASKAYNTNIFGTHLATQWSSLPHDTQEHADRYFLSLALSYLHGASEINMEEGLWRIESHSADFDRYSSACKRHQLAHQVFRKFMENNPRNGKLITPIACIQGRYDGWLCFGRDELWHQIGEQWQFGKAEESFDLLNIFYPRSKLDAIYCVPCPNEPQGWYTGMPYCMVDLAPIEIDWDNYEVIIFMGWNTYQAEDGIKMLNFVQNGGTLLLTRRHLNTCLERDGKVEYLSNDKSLELLLGENWQNTDDLIIRNIGKGQVYFVAQDVYPADTTILESYANTIKMLANKVSEKQKLKGWIEGNEDVAWSVYEQADGTRIFYLLNIRWWDRKTSEVTLHYGNKKTNYSVPFGNIVVVTN